MNNKKTIIIFISLLILLIILLSYNYIKNKKIDNIDRKVEYIFDNLTYDNVYNRGSDLLIKGIYLLNNELLEYEKNNNNNYKKYVINNNKDYLKIKNYSILINILSNKELNKYINDYNIIKYENNYYINYIDNFIINNNYIGSSIDILSYDNNYVYFKCISYYCDNYKYIGIIEDIPSCNYSIKESNFTIVFEDNNLRIYDLNEIKDIIK